MRRGNNPDTSLREGYMGVASLVYTHLPVQLLAVSMSLSLLSKLLSSVVSTSLREGWTAVFDPVRGTGGQGVGVGSGKKG